MDIIIIMEIIKMAKFIKTFHKPWKNSVSYIGAVEGDIGGVF